MARPKKIGLEYFPVDVTFDEKVNAIEMMHGNNGLSWVIKFWQNAYQTETGEVNFTGLFGELHANKCRITLEEHEKILDTALQIEFCYKTNSGLYTSNGIKKRIGSVSKESLSAIQRQEESKVKETPHYSANNDRITNEIEIKENKYVPYSPAFRISYRLWQDILNAGTNQKEPDLQKWANEVQKIHTTDKLSWDEIDQIMTEARLDLFWIKNLRSTESLRKNILNGNFDKFRPLPENLIPDDKYELKVKDAVEKEVNNAPTI
jgi:hypothetical protein